jgi:predicted molibdopterin-dependent oxidoreductase YjgC
MADARRLGVAEGDVVRIESVRGALELPARITHERDGVVFVPFHYGARAANELTMTVWDPVSKQPAYKHAAVRVNKVRAGAAPAPAPTTAAAVPAPDGRIPATVGGSTAEATSKVR